MAGINATQEEGGWGKIWSWRKGADGNEGLEEKGLEDEINEVLKEETGINVILEEGGWNKLNH